MKAIIECEFCMDTVVREDSVACQFCDGVFCSSDCFDAYLVAFPRCGGNPPKDVVDQAYKRVYS